MTQAYVIETDKGNLTIIGRLQSSNARTLVDIDDILKAVEGKRVLMHIHGGLVEHDVAIDIAHRLSQTHRTPGAHYLADSEAVQLYLIWPADIVTALKDIVADSVFYKIVKAVAGWFNPPAKNGVKGGQIGKSQADEDSLDTYYQQILPDEIALNEEETSPLLKTVPGETIQADGTDVRTAKMAEKDIISVLTVTRIAVNATRAILNRINTNPDPYEFEAMVREEVLNASALGPVGKRIWTQMKATAVEHATGGFQTFLQEVYEACQNLTLVGHSTGANIITALLPTLKTSAPEPKKLNVVFLAPAVTINTFIENIAAFQTHIQPPLRIYAMTPGDENADTTVPFYIGSLLQLVNFVFESDPKNDHVLGLAYYAQQQVEQRPALRQLVTIDTAHGCKTHGGFDDAQNILSQV